MVPFGLTDVNEHVMYAFVDFRVKADGGVDSRGSKEDAQPAHQQLTTLIGSYSLAGVIRPSKFKIGLATLNKGGQALLETKVGTMGVLGILLVSPSPKPEQRIGFKPSGRGPFRVPSGALPKGADLGQGALQAPRKAKQLKAFTAL